MTSASDTTAALQHPDRREREARVWAIVPAKPLSASKQRLKAFLGDDRPGLAMAMLRDVLLALAGCRRVARTVVVTADPRLAAIAEICGALVVDEGEAMGMRGAIDFAMEAIRQAGGRRFAILPGDLPLITADEVDRVLKSLDEERRSKGGNIVGIGPSADRGGTNLLCLDADQSIPLKYGPDSYEAHKQTALAADYTPFSLHSAAIGLDIDEPKDVEAFIDFCREHKEHKDTQTWKFLQERGYISSLEADELEQTAP